MAHTRRPLPATLLAVCLTVLPAAGIVSQGCSHEEKLRPNLLLITVDSLRADFLGCYGGEATVGIRMCQLAEEGMRFVWAFAPSPSSAPSIASILTSTYPSRHRVDETAASFLSGSAITLPEELRSVGYATAAFVGSPELNRSRNLHQGFDHYDDRVEPARPPALPQRLAEDTTSAALAWLESASAPWFVWIHYRDPHGPYAAPSSSRHASRARESGPGERLRVLATPTGRGGIPAYQALPGLFTREAYELRYRDEVRYVDGQIARLLAEIDRPNGRTGVLVTADHGEAFGEDRYYFTHGHSVGLDQIRIPLLWRPPGGAAPEEFRPPVSALDVAPTLLRAAGLVPPESFEGAGFASGSERPGAPSRARAVFAEHPTRVAVMIGSNYYGRDRSPTGAPDLRELTSEVLSLARARTAVLDRRAGGGAETDMRREALPEYEIARPTGAASFLEPRLAEFLALTR